MLVRSYWRLGIPSGHRGRGVSTRLLGRGRPLIEPVRVGALHITALRTRGRGTFVVFCLRRHRSILYLIVMSAMSNLVGTASGLRAVKAKILTYSSPILTSILHSHSISNIFQSFAKSQRQSLGLAAAQRTRPTRRAARRPLDGPDCSDVSREGASCLTFATRLYTPSRPLGGSATHVSTARARGTTHQVAAGCTPREMTRTGISATKWHALHRTCARRPPMRALITALPLSRARSAARLPGRHL